MCPQVIARRRDVLKPPARGGHRPGIKLLSSAGNIALRNAKSERRPGIWLLSRGWSAQKFKKSGVSVAMLKEASVSCEESIALGFTVRDIVGAGYYPSEIVRHFKSEDFLHAGFTVGKLKELGFSLRSLVDAGFY